MATATEQDQASGNGNPIHSLTKEQLDEIGKEMQAIHDEV